MVVGRQPEVHASCTAHQVRQVLVLAVDQALEHLGDAALEDQLLRSDLASELALLLLGLCFFVLVGLRILKLTLRNEAIRDVGGDQVHVLHVVINQVHVVAERLHHGTKLWLVWDGDCWDLRGSQIWLVLSSVGLVGHHAKSDGQEEIATALEGSRVTLEYVEAFTISLTMGLEE